MAGLELRARKKFKTRLLGASIVASEASPFMAYPSKVSPFEAYPSKVGPFTALLTCWSKTDCSLPSRLVAAIQVLHYSKAGSTQTYEP